MFSAAGLKSPARHGARRSCRVGAFVAGVSLLLTAQALSLDGQSDCQPCTIRITPEGAEYSFFFHTQVRADGRRAVQSIRVMQGSAEVQELKVHSMMGVPARKNFFFRGVDINFDGFQDLEFITSQGVANAHADYWVFTPAAKKFSYLGNYSVFTIETDTHRLKTYERGGYGGMVYESDEYAFADGKLLLMRSEKQEATTQPNVFRQVIRERVKGVLKVTHRSTVKGKAPQDEK
jgi:hypothetical protein